MQARESAIPEHVAVFKCGRGEAEMSISGHVLRRLAPGLTLMNRIAAPTLPVRTSVAPRPVGYRGRETSMRGYVHRDQGVDVEILQMARSCRQRGRRQSEANEP